MILAFPMEKKYRNILPSAVHVDGTSRPQIVRKKTNKKFYKLIEEFEKITGEAIVINTSFNLKDQTMVLTPEDAIKTFLNCEMDVLILGSYVVRKKIL